MFIAAPDWKFQARSAKVPVMDLEVFILNEVKERHISVICGILKKGANDLIFKTETESQM